MNSNQHNNPPHYHNETWTGWIAHSQVDLREDPSMAAHSFQYDSMQNSQLLYGDLVYVIGAVGNYLHVRAPKQQRFFKGEWNGYLGYIPRSVVFNSTTNQYDSSLTITIQHDSVDAYDRICIDPGCLSPDQTLSFATQFNILFQCLNGWCQVGHTYSNRNLWIRKHDLRILKNDDISRWINNQASVQEMIDLRNELVKASTQLLGSVYFWGGRSSFNWYQFKNDEELSGVDCSGLVGLTYQSWGIILPRDAHDMYLKSSNVTHPSQLSAGDLFFYQKPNSQRVIHVMMYIGDFEVESNVVLPSLIESTSSVNASRIVSIQNRLGVLSVDELTWGHEVKQGESVYQVFYGRFLGSGTS